MISSTHSIARWIAARAFVFVAACAFVLSPDGALAQRTGVRCQAFFRIDRGFHAHPFWRISGGAPISFGEMRVEPALAGRGSDRWETQPTVQFDESSPGRFGGRLFNLRRHGREWHSEFAPEGTIALQGDPRTMVAMTSPLTGLLFGFSQLAPDRITVPDAFEMRGALGALNAALVELGYEPVPIQFAASDGIQDDRTFLNAWVERAEIPIATDAGAVFLHDLGFHAHSLVLPPEVVRHSQAVFARRLDFVDWLSRRSRREPALSWFEGNWRMAIYELLSASLDVGPGNLFIDYLGRHDRSRPHSERQMLAEARAAETLGRFAAMGRSPDRALITLFSGTRESWEREGEIRIPGASSERLRRLRELAVEFFREVPNDRARSSLLMRPNPREDHATTESLPRALIARVDERRLEISRAARLALSRPPANQ